MRKIHPTEADLSLLKQLETKKQPNEDRSESFSKRIIKKPWGYEYLLYRNDNSAIWILFLEPQAQTSMHCHPNKKTSLAVLSGKAKCSTLTDSFKVKAAQTIILDKKVFHSTKNVSEKGAFVLEIETPVAKGDLVRAADCYGRKDMGYEYENTYSNNYNYFSLIEQEIYYNHKKKFGQCSIELLKAEHLSELLNSGKILPEDSICLLKGSIVSQSNSINILPGDIFSLEQAKYFDIEFKDQEVMLIRKIDSTTRLSDHIISCLYNHDIKNFYFVPTTVNAHLVDAILRNTNVNAYPLITEEAVTMAAEAFSKLTGETSAVVIGSGAAAVNAINGVANSWIDSSPLFVLSAQPRLSSMWDFTANKIRQLTNKEINIEPLVKPITKFCKSVKKAELIGETLDSAISMVQEGRKGPCWIDIPIDLLGKEINTQIKQTCQNSKKVDLGSDIKSTVSEVYNMLKKSSRPVMLAGYGIRASNAQSEFIMLAEKLSIPVLTSRRGVDLVANDFPLYFGRPGSYGQRAANFIIQNCDLLISVGCRLSIPLITRNFESFAQKAKKIVVDIDPEELNKKTIKTDIPVNCDAAYFVSAMLENADTLENNFDDWIEKCKNWHNLFPPNEESKNSNKTNNPYFFIEALSNQLQKNDIIVSDGGSCLDYLMQAFRVKSGQRIISSPGLEYRGFAIPAAIGISYCKRKKAIICISDKLGFQKNITELQTITESNLNIKIFVINTKGNTQIKQIQSDYFGKRHINVSEDFLDIESIAKIYGIKSVLISANKEAGSSTEKILNMDNAVLCDIRIPEEQELIPRLKYTVTSEGKWIPSALDNMYPFLDKSVIRDNTIV